MKGRHVPRSNTLFAEAAVMGMTSPIAWLRSFWIPLDEVRAETWALGTRHQGRVIAGARIEGSDPSISFRRAILLKAVIRRQMGSAAGQAELTRDGL